MYISPEQITPQQQADAVQEQQWQLPLRLQPANLLCIHLPALRQCAAAAASELAAASTTAAAAAGAAAAASTAQGQQQ
jgi:hypothetical protein